MGPKERALLVKLCKKQIAICVAAHKMKQYHNAPEIGQLLYGEKVKVLNLEQRKINMVKVVKNLLEVVKHPKRYRYHLGYNESWVLLATTTEFMFRRGFTESQSLLRIWCMLQQQARYHSNGIPFPGYN